jgi:class 3 adenylate cyclase/tetratricopeptide (TPR) repeat protein
MTHVKRCRSCGEENADRAKFCQACASPLPESAPTAEVRRVVTIVFADVTGSTRLGERLDPEALRRVMGRYFDAMAEVIERHGGTVEKFIGDAVMAVFGIPRLHEDDPLRAVRAAGEMRQALASLNEALEREHGVGFTARIGVNTGEVVAGDASSGQRLVTGDAVNVAARLEQAAAPGEILLGETTYRLVKDAVEVEAVEPLELKGKADRVPAFRLVDVRSETAGHERHLDSPMVGRDRELDMLAGALDRAITERTSHLFTLLGPAGVGKSRLVAEFLNGPAAGATRLRGRCLSYGEGITFYPLAEVIQQAAGVDKEDDVETARGKLAALVEGAPNADGIVANVGGMLAWDEPGAVEDANWSVRKLFEHLARVRPLVVVFDDIHWAEPVFLDLIEHLADWTRDAAVLLLCVARPELLEVRTGWAGGKMNASSILLEPLDGEASSTLVDNLLGEADIPEAARRRILDAAEGNPLFVEEMLGMLIDDGLLRFEDGAWHAVEDLADVTVPPTIQLLLAARLDRLDAEERAVIERGSVEGKVFHRGAVVTLSSEAVRPNVPTRLLALARKELIRPDRADFAGEDAFRFRHLLIRDAAYHAMPKEQRADLHERFAAWLEGVAGDRLAEYEEILAYHLEQAYRFRSELGTADDRTRDLAAAAARHAMTSAGRALAREDFSAARGLLGRCVELTSGRTRAVALVGLAEADAASHDFPAALGHARAAMDEARAIGDRALELRAELVALAAAGQTDPTRTLRETRGRIVAICEELETIGDAGVLAHARLAEAIVEFFSGRCDTALSITESVLESGVELDPIHRRDAVITMAVAAFFGSTPVDDALAVTDRLEPLTGGRLVSTLRLSTVRLALYAMAGREAEALDELAESDRLVAEIANPSTEITRLQTRGEAMIHLGRLEDAADVYRYGVEVLDSLGETGFNSTMVALLAGVLCRLGRFDEAERHVRRSIEITADDDFASQAYWRLARAHILSSRGEHDGALRLTDEAIDLVSPTDYLDFQAEAQAMRGLVLRDAGRHAEAREAYERALGLYERKGAVPAAERVRAELAALPL